MTELQQFWKYSLRTQSVICKFWLLMAWIYQKSTAKQKEEIICDSLTAKIFERRADRPRSQRSNSVELSASSKRIKVSFIQCCFGSFPFFLVKTSLHCVFLGVLNPFVKLYSIQWIKPLPNDIFWYFSSNISESAIFYCRLQIHKIVKAWLKRPQDFLLNSLSAKFTAFQRAFLNCHRNRWLTSTKNTFEGSLLEKTALI